MSTNQKRKKEKPQLGQEERRGLGKMHSCKTQTNIAYYRNKLIDYINK